jgi:carboxylesterase type B
LVIADHIIDTYQHSHPDYTDAQIGLAIAGDTTFLMPAIATAEALVKSNTPVWMYLFTAASTRLDGRLGSPHAMDLPFTFNNLGADGANDIIDPNANDYQPLADTIQDAWINFIRHGTPETRALEDWPTYNPTNRSTMILDFESRLEHNPFAANREAWGTSPSMGSPQASATATQRPTRARAISQQRSHLRHQGTDSAQHDRQNTQNSTSPPSLRETVGLRCRPTPPGEG